MTKVRVSDETPNLSHSSNLISTVRLENPSSSLMRSIRARGCTHCGLFIHFLVERTREKREEVELEKIEASFAELGMHPKATS
jgi:hypothetical protein